MNKYKTINIWIFTLCRIDKIIQSVYLHIFNLNGVILEKEAYYSVLNCFQKDESYNNYGLNCANEILILHETKNMKNICAQLNLFCNVFFF